LARHLPDVGEDRGPGHARPFGSSLVRRRDCPAARGDDRPAWVDRGFSRISARAVCDSVCPSPAAGPRSRTGGRAMTAILALFAAGSLAAAQGEPDGRVGSKSFTESVILGEMARQLVAASGTPCQHRRELGGTQILFHALESGELDVYPEYTGTITGE